MTFPLKKSYKELIAEADSVVKHVTLDEAQALLQEETVELTCEHCQHSHAGLEKKQKHY